MERQWEECTNSRDAVPLILSFESLALVSYIGAVVQLACNLRENPVTTPDVYSKIKELLAQHSIQYREIAHEQTHTSEESAKARGEDLSIGGKAILLKVGDAFRLFVLSAAKKLDSKKIKEHFSEQRLRFATPKELQEMTTLVPGAVPPFGRPVTDFDLCVDVSVTNNTKIAFNAGSLTVSMIMDMADYLKIASPEIFEFSADI
jgi:Ala-tRNA(Pro) deacylase